MNRIVLNKIISFSGISNTGKTTLCKMLMNYLPNSTCISEIFLSILSRKNIPLSNIQIIREKNPNLYFQIQKEASEEFLQICRYGFDNSTFNYIIFDRNIIDALAYLLIYNKLSKTDISSFLKLIKESFKYIYCIFYIKVNDFNLFYSRYDKNEKIDISAEKLKEEQKAFDKTINHFIKKYKNTIYVLDYELSFEEKIEKILKVLKK